MTCRRECRLSGSLMWRGCNNMSGGGGVARSRRRDGRDDHDDDRRIAAARRLGATFRIRSNRRQSACRT